MNKRQLFVLILVVSAICLIMGIYYLVPNVWHPLVFDGTATNQHIKHALLCFGLAVIGVVASRFVLSSSPGSASKK